jgi:hypothetical protein
MHAFFRFRSRVCRRPLAGLHMLNGCNLGTGISINVIQGPSPLNARATIDGNSPSDYSLPTTAGFNYGLQFFEIQSLSNGSHILEVLLLDTTASDGSTVGSLIRFDVAYVTGASSSTPSSQRSSTTPGSSPTQGNIPSHSSSAKSSSKYVHQPLNISLHSLPLFCSSIVGPVVGGVLGGLAAIAFAAIFILRRIRKVQSRRKLDNLTTIRAPDAPFDPQMYQNPLPQDIAITAPYALSNASTLAPPRPLTDNRQSTFTASASSVVPLMPPADTQFAPVSSRLSTSGSGSQLLAGSSPFKLNNTAESSATDLTRAEGLDTSNHPAPPQPSIGALTAEQAELVRGLHANGVPPAEIASVMEAMRREREGGQGTSNLQGGPASVEDPPRYDFKERMS